MSDTESIITNISEAETIKKKKGRPKKEKEIVIEVEKKKRGRKKKEVEIVEVKQKKKRGRKATLKFFSSSIRKQIPISSSIYDNNHILHIDADINEDLNDKININLEEYNVDTTIQEYPYIKDKLKDLINNDKDILLDYINCKKENCNDNDTLRDLYESRIKNREKQDKLLVDNLDILHKPTTKVIKIQPKPAPKAIKTIHEYDNITISENSFIFLQQFVDNKEWLDYTDISCWWCCHSFTTTPIGMPVDYNNKKFRVKGVFCSFACMVAYKDIYVQKNSPNLIKFFYKKLTGEFDIHKKIQKAPSRFLLKMFGGPLSIEEFRKSTTESTIYKMVEYPMFISRDYVEKIDLSVIKNANSNIFDDSVIQKVIKLDDTKIIEAKTRLEKNNTKTCGKTLDDFING